jgi:hypothetical protein
MCISLEAARKHLSDLWVGSTRSFKFLPTPVKAPPPPPPPKDKPKPPSKLTDSQSFDAVLLHDQPEGAARGESSSGSSRAENVFSQLRGHIVPFGTRSPKKPAAAPAAKSTGKRKLERPEAITLDLLSPAIELPQRLGRGDVQQKREHKIRYTTVPVVVGRDGVDEALAPKIRRSQAYSIPDNRSRILADCVQAYRAAAR